MKENIQELNKKWEAAIGEIEIKLSIDDVLDDNKEVELSSVKPLKGQCKEENLDFSNES